MCVCGCSYVKYIAGTYRVRLHLVGKLESKLPSLITIDKWDDICSNMFRVDSAVRQGAVLSPYLFALYLDDLSGLHLNGCTIVLYADNILLISTSVCQLDKPFHMCEKELSLLDTAVNFKKSCCLRIGPHCDAYCENPLSMTGSMLQ